MLRVRALNFVLLQILVVSLLQVMFRNRCTVEVVFWMDNLLLMFVFFSPCLSEPVDRIKMLKVLSAFAILEIWCGKNNLGS